MRFYFLILFWGLSVLGVSAQTLQGVVTDLSDKRPLSPVTVVNTTTRQVTYTDANGFYTIPARDNDIIAFSYIGYKATEKRKQHSVIVATANISMERISYQLQEVMLRPGRLTQYQIDSADRATTYRSTLMRRPPSPFMSPVSALAEKFSRKAKRAYRFQKDFATAEVEKFIDTRYTTELVHELTGLTGDTIAHFMYAYPMPYDYARAASNLEMKMWIKDNYKQWIKKQAAADSTSH